MRPPRALALPVLALAAACAAPARSGGSAAAAPARPAAAVPPTPPERLHTAEFYSDLGPEGIDVSHYPARQRREYRVFKDACARCHTLARAVNAPIVGRGWWEFYMAGMRLRSRWQGRPLTSEEVQSVLDFLEYDSQARKVARAAEFEALTGELKRRFDGEIERRVAELQKANPRPLPPLSPR